MARAGRRQRPWADAQGWDRRWGSTAWPAWARSRSAPPGAVHGGAQSVLAALQNLESETQAHAVSVHAGLRGQATAPSVCVGGRQRKALGPGCRSAANAAAAGAVASARKGGPQRGCRRCVPLWGLPGLRAPPPAAPPPPSPWRVLPSSLGPCPRPLLRSVRKWP